MNPVRSVTLMAPLASRRLKTWEHFRNVADAADDAFAYPSVTFVGDRALLTYFNYKGGLSLQL